MTGGLSLSADPFIGDDQLLKLFQNRGHVALRHSRALPRQGFRLNEGRSTLWKPLIALFYSSVYQKASEGVPFVELET